jgi:hypothetical protein
MNRRRSRTAGARQTIEQDIIASLKRRVSPDELEDEDWLQFKAQMQQGDEIWYYRTPPDTWTGFPLSGREGYALVRDEKVIDEILLSIS